MARFLRQNTAVIVTVGPFFDKTDGVTLETALTITNEKISFVVDLDNGSAPTLVLDNVTGATSGTDNDLNYITNCDAALMQLELSAANTNYVGRAFLTITDAANHVPVFHEFVILPANVYDALMGTDRLEVDTMEVSHDSTAADNAEAFFDGTGYAGGTIKLGVDLVAILGTALTETAGQISAAFKKFFNIGTPANTMDSLATAAELAKVPKSDSNVTFNATAVAGIQSGLATPTNITAASGVALTAAYDAAKTAAQASTALTNATWTDARAAAIDSILADTNELQTDWVNGGRLDLLVDAIISELNKVPKSDGNVAFNNTAIISVIKPLFNWAISAGVITVKDASDNTLFTANVTGTAGADPVTSVDLV